MPPEKSKTPESSGKRPQTTEDILRGFDEEIEARREMRKGLSTLNQNASGKIAGQEESIQNAKEAVNSNIFQEQTKSIAMSMAEMTMKNPERYEKFTKNADMQINKRVQIYNDSIAAVKESVKDDPVRKSTLEEVQRRIQMCHKRYKDAYEASEKALPDSSEKYLETAKMIGAVSEMERTMNAYDELRGDYRMSAQLHQPDVDMYLKVWANPKFKKAQDAYDKDFSETIQECDAFLAEHENDSDPAAQDVLPKIRRAKKLYDTHYPLFPNSDYDRQMVFMTKKMIQLELMTYKVTKEAEKAFPDELDSTRPSALAESEPNLTPATEAITTKPVETDTVAKPEVTARGGSVVPETIAKPKAETVTIPPSESAEEIAAKEAKAKEVAAQKQKEIAARKAAEAEQQAKALAASEADLAIAASEKKNAKKEKPGADIGKELAEQEARELAAQKEAARIALEKATAAKKAAEEAKIAAEKKAAEEAKVAAERKAAEDAKVAAERKAAEEAKIAAEAKAAQDARTAVAAKAANDADAAPAPKENAREFILKDGEIFLPGKKVYVAYYLADLNDTLALDFVKLSGKNKTDTSDYFESKQTEGGWIIRPKAGLHGTFLVRADGNDHMIPVEILPDFGTLAKNDAQTGPREF